LLGCAVRQVGCDVYGNGYLGAHLTR
jgi:hypothetical protein